MPSSACYCAARRGPQLGLWGGDAQVVSLIARKKFGAVAEVGARVTVAAIGEWHREASRMDPEVGSFGGYSNTGRREDRSLLAADRW